LNYTLMEVTSVSAVKRAAARVTRYFPAEVYTVTHGRPGEEKFKKALDELITVIYALDVSKFDEGNFDFVEKVLDIVIPAVEIHLLQSGPMLQPTQPDFCEALERLRIARDGIARGYPADPARRPSREEVRHAAASRIADMLRDGEL